MIRCRLCHLKMSCTWLQRNVRESLCLTVDSRRPIAVLLKNRIWSSERRNDNEYHSRTDAYCVIIVSRTDDNQMSSLLSFSAVCYGKSRDDGQTRVRSNVDSTAFDVFKVRATLNGTVRTMNTILNVASLLHHTISQI